MGKEKGRITFILLVLICVLIGSAIGEREAWDCPDCNRKGNTGNFCGGCGHPAPENEGALMDTCFPEGISFITCLDVNSENGFERGVFQGDYADFSREELSEGEYYSPALVVLNSSDQPIGVTISYLIDDYKASWDEYPVEPENNLAYRLFDESLTNSEGQHTIIWYCNGAAAATFSWNVR